jgi:hypothetical protein
MSVAEAPDTLFAVVLELCSVTFGFRPLAVPLVKTPRLFCELRRSRSSLSDSY